MPDLNNPEPNGCGIYRPSDNSDPYILCVGSNGCEKYYFDGGNGEPVRRLSYGTGYGPKIVSLGKKTYAVGSDNGHVVEEWNGSKWVKAPEAFQVWFQRYSSGVMAVPADFVC